MIQSARLSRRAVAVRVPELHARLRAGWAARASRRSCWARATGAPAGRPSPGAPEAVLD